MVKFMVKKGNKSSKIQNKVGRGGAHLSIFSLRRLRYLIFHPGNRPNIARFAPLHPIRSIGGHIGEYAMSGNSRASVVWRFQPELRTSVMARAYCAKCDCPMNNGAGYVNANRFIFNECIKEA